MKSGPRSDALAADIVEPRCGPHVLLVDAQPAALEPIGRLLQQLGYQVNYASDGEMGAELARRMTPVLVIMDLMQPESQLFGDGTQSRDFTYVDDIAAATMAARRDLGYEIINVGGGRTPSSLIEMINIMEELLGKAARIEYLGVHKTDMTETHADISKAHRLLGWQPKVGFREGLERTVKWYRDNHAWAKDIVL